MRGHLTREPGSLLWQDVVDSRFVSKSCARLAFALAGGPFSVSHSLVTEALFEKAGFHGIFVVDHYPTIAEDVRFPAVSEVTVGGILAQVDLLAMLEAVQKKEATHQDPSLMTDQCKTWRTDCNL